MNKVSYGIEKRHCPLIDKPVNVLIIKNQHSRESDGKVELSTSPPRCQNEECLLHGTSKCLLAE